jgi:hypothetical protein
MSERNKRYKFYNNGKINIKVFEGEQVPKGFIPGMKPLSEDVLKARSEKTRKTNLERYGTENPMQSSEVKEKLRQSNIKKYGVDNPSKAKSVKKKKKETTIEHYGTENPFQSDEIKEKIRQTNLKRYGVENPSQADEVKAKKKLSVRSHYGVEHPLQIKEVQERMKNNFIEKYGVDNPFKSEEVKERISKTCQEKYGVPWACLRPEARLMSTNNSGPNKMFSDILDNNSISYDREFVVDKYSYDFKVGNILIEINPYATHNTVWSPFGDSNITPIYHQKKSRTAEEQGYQVIHIFDWDDQEKIVKNLLLPKERVFARKTKVFGIDKKEVREFLNEHHLQGSCNGQSVCLGLRDEYGELISLMTFGKPRYNKNYQWELLRYCSSKSVVGGAEKLFKYFIKEHNTESIISYCDRSKFRGDVYHKLGFTLKSEGKPSCHWYNFTEKTLSHITDNLLRQRGFDQLFGTNYGKGTSNEELIIKRGYVPIYDCGQDTFVFQYK